MANGRAMAHLEKDKTYFDNIVAENHATSRSGKILVKTIP
jgi:hypothetical protein